MRQSVKPKAMKMSKRSYPLPEGYHNQIVFGDVLKTLKDLPDRCMDVIYADPDYNVGINYSGRKYNKRWDDYIDWYGELMTESMRVLKETGNLFTINYPRQNAYLWVKYLDDISYAVNEYVWTYNTNVGHSPRKFTNAHRTILHATKSRDNAFYKDNVAQPYKNPNDPRIQGRIASGSKGRMPYSWLYFDLVKNVSKDKTFHACQIPLGLVRLLLDASCKKKDKVFILFGGSGSEVRLAKDMGLTYLTCEMHPEYHKLIQQQVDSFDPALFA